MTSEHDQYTMMVVSEGNAYINRELGEMAVAVARHERRVNDIDNLNEADAVELEALRLQHEQLKDAIEEEDEEHGRLQQIRPIRAQKYELFANESRKTLDGAVLGLEDDLCQRAQHRITLAKLRAA